VVVYAAVANDMVSILRAGKNVVSCSVVPLVYPNAVDAAFTDPLREAALSGGVSFFTTGIDSGFANDVLPLALSGVSRTIDSIQWNRRLQRRAPSRWTLDAHSPAKGLDPVCEPDEP
jgi:4-hydroxy-tetrahydrodipicolinate reductase